MFFRETMKWVAALFQPENSFSRRRHSLSSYGRKSILEEPLSCKTKSFQKGTGVLEHAGSVRIWLFFPQTDGEPVNNNWQGEGKNENTYSIL